MKAGSKSIIPLCGLLATLCPLPVASQTVTTETSKGAIIITRAKDNGATKSPPANAKAEFSAGLDDILKLVKAGVEESVILVFIQNSPVAYQPSAQEIIKLRELGISAPIITALIHRGEELRRRAAEAQKETPPAAPPPANNQSAAPTVPAPAYVDTAYPATYPTVVYSGYPTYSYSVASYGYGGCYYPRYYSYYPRSCYYGGFYPRVSFGLHLGGVHFRGSHGFRHCR